jgi:hypothetical protein
MSMGDRRDGVIACYSGGRHGSRRKKQEALGVVKAQQEE